MSNRKKNTYKGRSFQRGVINHSHGPGPSSFGPWAFEAGTGDLHDGKTTTRLEPQVAKLLEYFLTHQNQIISRDELIAAVWENRTVSDDAINRCVSILRQILSPDDKNAYIETVVRKGYIAHFPGSPDTPGIKAPSSRIRKFFLLAALAGLTGLFLYGLTSRVGDKPWEVRAPRSAGPPMVAVLPFVFNSQTGGDEEFFTNGVHDDLLTQLAKLQSMRVISSTSVKEYRGTEHNIRKIGEELGADVILEGSVQIADRQIRINAQLIDARTDEHLWAETYDRELSPANIFELQSEIAGAIAQELNATLTAQDRAQLALVPTQNMAAYRAYHRAMQLRRVSNSAVQGPEYLQALEEAVELDPAFTRAWAQLVSTLAFQNFGRDDPELNRRTEQALQNLHTIAPGSAEYLMGLASYVYYTLQDYDRAHDIISQALTMIPGDIHALELRTWIERRQGDSAASLQSKKEIQEIDPRNPKWTDMVVHGLFIMHQYDESWSEIVSSPLESFYMDETANLLLFRDDRDYRRWQESAEALCQRYEQPDCGWEVHIANRDYRAALDSLDRTNVEDSWINSPKSLRNRILTYWLMNEGNLPKEESSRWRSQLEQDPEESGKGPKSLSNIGLAMLEGARGNTGKARELVKGWLSPEQVDWAERNEFKHVACRVLGMIAETQAAVNCIREGLEEPSHVTPFLEPYLPFYDSIRDQPEFIAMVAEIDVLGFSSKLY